MSFSFYFLFSLPKQKHCIKMMQPNLINPNPKIYDVNYGRKKTSSLPYVPDITDRIDAAEVYGTTHFSFNLILT
jgi:hypothetical protein